MRRRIGRAAAAAALLGLVCVAVPRPAEGAETLKKLEKEFKKAIERVSAATVVCLPPAGANPVSYGSSGVIVSRKGLVLSDGDVGAYRSRVDGRFQIQWSDEVTVRVPNLRSGGFKPYTAKVLHRDRKLDTSLLRVEDGPPAGFGTYLLPFRSGELRVGQFTFAAGNAWALSKEGAPTLTAGLVSALTYLPDNHPQGRLQHLYTSAAVNPGVNGGPVVDVKGRLVGTVSSSVPSGPADQFQFLGRVVPIDRLRSVYGDIAESKELFPTRAAPATRAPTAATMETVFHHTARDAYPAVVSLEVHRAPLEQPKPPEGAPKKDPEPKGKTKEAPAPGDKKPKKPKGKRPKRRTLPPFPSYRGPVSGFVVSTDGLIVTSLYNLTSVMVLTHPNLVNTATQPEFDVRRQVERITRVTVHFGGGAKSDGQVLAYHEGLGIAVLKAPVPAAAASSVHTLVAAPPESFVAGRFVLALGNPYGAERLPDPLLTFGILSKRHAPDASKPWRGQWQTDAAAIDSNSGGPAVDLSGRLLGMITPWDIQHGRNSGVGFVVPWTLIEEVLPAMAGGRTFARAFLGVTWDIRKPAEGETVDWRVEPAKLKTVVAGSGAADAGLVAGDIIVRLDGKAIDSIGDAGEILARKWSGDTLAVVVLRGGEEKPFECVLGMRK